MDTPVLMSSSSITLVLQSSQLLFSVGNIVAFGRENVVVTGGGHIGNHHPVFDPFLEIDVFIEGNIGPIVNQLNGLIDGTDSVDTAKALDNADRIPVNVIVDQIIAILEVLAFGNTIRCDQQVQFPGIPGA